MEDYTESGCMSIVRAAYEATLKNTKSIEQSQDRINFTKREGGLFAAWCLLADQEQDRLSNFTIVRNHKLLRQKGLIKK